MKWKILATETQSPRRKDVTTKKAGSTKKTIRASPETLRCERVRGEMLIVNIEALPNGSPLLIGERG